MVFTYHSHATYLINVLRDTKQHTLSVEKIPVVLRPVIELPVKIMASIGTQEISRKAEIQEFLSILAKF